ncbi:MAG: DUF2550 domain-containing protein [Propionibacteriaceae bacterium]|jgi:hypothetical protein|nr:DUF2550 domain-containing protein [Propionibacteriaceae bacterium]
MDDGQALVAFIGAASCLAVVAVVAWLVWRRRHLGAGPGTFDCYYRHAHDARPQHWSQGIAQYRGDALWWYPLLSFTLQPRFRWLRLGIDGASRRWPSTAERGVLYEGQQVLRVRNRAEGDICDLAMSPSAVNGLLAWIEAAPPGEGQYGHTRAPGGGLPPPPSR